MGTDGVADCWGIWDYLITAPGNPRVVQFHNVPTAQRFSHIQFRDVRAVGLNRCGLAVDGLLYCWGDGYHGGLGDGTTPAFRHAPSAPVISR